ncbi:MULTISPECIES: hypothetical protein [unclassified Nocardia]
MAARSLNDDVVLLEQELLIVVEDEAGSGVSWTEVLEQAQAEADAAR